MAITYEFYKESDNDILKVFNKASYMLFYISDNNVIEVGKGIIRPLILYSLPITKDGKYKLILSAPNETNVEIEFDVVKFLQNTLIKDIRGLLCNCDCNCGSNCTNYCISTVAKKSLKYKGIFIKMLVSQYIMLPLHYDITIFNEYIKKAIKNAKCNMQKGINSIIAEECLHGSIENVDKLTKTFLAIYWFGFYYIEYKKAETDEEKKFVNDKYKFETIDKCLCDVCINTTGLKNIFDNEDEEEGGGEEGGGTPIVNPVISYWQFSNLSDNIDFAETIDQAYLDARTKILFTTFKAGHTFNYSTVGRVGFAIGKTTQNKYKILDTFGIDITSIVFDTYYNSTLQTQIYISKEFLTPSAVYFKLV